MCFLNTLLFVYGVLNIKSAYYEAKKKADEFCELEMSKATGGVSLPFDMKSFL